MSNNWTRVMQLEEGIEFLKAKLAKEGSAYAINKAEFETASGVGINVTTEDVHKLVDEVFVEHKTEIDEQKWDFQFNRLLYKISDRNKWVDKKEVMDYMKVKQVALLGEKPANDGKRKAKNKMTTEEKKANKPTAEKEEEVS